MISNAICNTFKQEILQDIHQPGDIYKITLIRAGHAADFGERTSNYSELGADEVADGNGYTSGGQELQGFTFGRCCGTEYIDWTTDPAWKEATISADGFVIYNETRAGRAIGVWAFRSGPTTSTNGTFEVLVPRRNLLGGAGLYRLDVRDHHDRRPFDWASGQMPTFGI